MNIADRLQSLAEPSGIVISGSAYDYVKGKLSIGLESLGEQTVKNVDEPVRAYRVGLKGIPSKRAAAFGTSRRYVVALAIVLALLTITGAWWVWEGKITPVAAKPASIAVLPFENLSGDPADGRIADGITEDIITDLSRFREFAVIAKDSTEAYRNKPIDVRR